MDRSPKTNPSPASKRRLFIIVGIIAAIMVMLFVGMNLSHYQQRHESPPDQTADNPTPPAQR
jgi:hypothetical protein